MEWTLTCQTRNGRPRRQFNSWHVPKNVLKQYGLKDKDECTILLQVGGFRDLRTCKLTSGGEFRLSNALAKAVRKLTDIEPSMLIQFEVIPNQKMIEDSLASDVEQSLTLSTEQRRDRLSSASGILKKVQFLATAFVRNPDVIAEVLSRANGICEECSAKAPLVKASNGSPYLEVHHRVWLADGGKDTTANAVALCPNCHRRLHFGSKLT